MRAVRDRCVWTQQIDHRALVPYLEEEAAELIDAVEAGTRDDLREELGDLLWQVLFHAEIASRAEEGAFDIDDVASTLTEKMTRRHPHVFGDAAANTPEEVLVHWNAAKAAEKRTRTSVLDGVSHHMPSLALAQKLLGKARQVGVETLGTARQQPVTARQQPVTARQQSQPETSTSDQGLGSPLLSRGHDDERMPRSEAELGDAILGLVATAREHGWDAERALRERLRTLETDIRAAERP